MALNQVLGNPSVSWTCKLGCHVLLLRIVRQSPFTNTIPIRNRHNFAAILPSVDPFFRPIQTPLLFSIREQFFAFK